MKYLALVGSRSYGLELDGSDYDYFIVGNAAAPIPEKYCFQKTPEEMLKQLLLRWEHPYALMPFFSPQIEADEKTKTLIIDSREWLVASFRKRLYTTYKSMAESFLQYDAAQSAYYAKMNAYGLLWLDTLARYAKGETFAAAHLPSESIKPFLQAIRVQSEIAIAQIPAVKQDLLSRAEDLFDFYDAEEDTPLIAKFEADFNSILEDDAND